MFIADAQTRNLLRKFCSKGVTCCEFSELGSLIAQHAPSLSGVLESCTDYSTSSMVCCLPDWQNLILALASVSPVCGLVHPSESLYDLLREVADRLENIRKSSIVMEKLQIQIPVLFELISTLPRISAQILKPILETLVEKSKAPFPDQSTTLTQAESTSDISQSPLSHFSSPPCMRARHSYLADRQSKRKPVCSKHSSGHPTLLPGTFTMYCQHGWSAILTSRCGVIIIILL